MIKKMMEEWKKELIEAGEIDPSEELTLQEIQLKYQDYQIKKMKSAMGGLSERLGITMPEEKKPKKKKKPKKATPHAPKEPKEKRILGGPKRARFSQIVRELDELQKKVDARVKQHNELFNALCSSACPELLETINDQSMTDSEKKMKEVRKIMKKLVNKSKNGFPVPSDLEDEFSLYLDHKDQSNKELSAIYSQMKEKSELLSESLIEMEEA